MTSPSDAPAPASSPPRASLVATRPAPGTAADDTAAVEEQVRYALLQRLLDESRRAEIGHLVLIAAVAVLLWPSQPRVALVGWVGAIAACTLIRGTLRRRVEAGALSVPMALRRLRLALAVTGLAWGVGAAALMPGMPVAAASLLLVVLFGLAAGGVASLTGDLWSFRYFIAGLFAPVPIGILQGTFQRDTAVAIFLVVFYAIAMVVFHQASHRLLYDHVRQSFEFARRERTAVRDRAYVDALLASAPVAIAVLGGDGRIRGVNPQFETLFGFTSSEVVGEDLTTLIVPKSEQAKAARFDHRARQGEKVAEEFERRRKNGSLVPVLASASRIAGGAGDEIFVMYKDISDRRRAQDALTQLASIVQTSEDAIIGQTLDGVIVTWNAAAERMFGYALGEVRGRPITLLVPPDRAGEVDEILERLRRGERVKHFETVRLHKDGGRVPVSLSISLTRDSGDRISGFSTIARDVSDQVETRDALREARDAAQRLAQTRTAFLANMSHEIRTPMNAILGLTELLLDTQLATEQRHSLTLVQTSAETLLTLLNDVLDLSKIEAEHLTLESIVFDLRHLVESTVDMMAVRARERRLNLVADVAPDVPASVRGDPTRLRQVLTNLISNAIKFTHEGEVIVVVAQATGPEGGPIISFIVRDTGIGIPADKLVTIFEEFTQADTSTTRKYGGTGLGLAISRRLVHLMGGKLTVSSQVGRGTEFAFALGLDAGAAVPVVPTAKFARLAGRRVLVVDDNPTNRRVLSNILSAANVQVTEANSGPTGLAVLRRAQREEAPFDLAVLDSQMPEMDGFELARAVRADRAIAQTLLVMLTSSAQRGDGQRCRELGIEGYLPKPASRSDLLETLSTVLTGPVAATADQGGVVTRHTIAESRQRLEILVAEDNPVNQEVVAAMLGKRGHRVDVVATGRAAVDAAAARRYDVILMDIQMPEMDGFEATHAIRATPAGGDLPIIALTAHALSGERERCLSHGMTDYLTKPIRGHELFAAVEGWALNVAARAHPEETPDGTREGSPPVDVEGFRNEMRLAGAEYAVDPVLDTFLESAPHRIAAIVAALANGSGSDIERAAHAFRSAAATIGANALAALLQQLEAAGKKSDVAHARALGDRVEQERGAVVDYLNELRKLRTSA